MANGTEWAERLVQHVGARLKEERGSRSALWLSDRTEALGQRISPTIIAKLDSGHRGSVLSLPELLILASALDVPIAELLSGAEIMPGATAPNGRIVAMLIGKPKATTRSQLLTELDAASSAIAKAKRLLKETS